jgi:hypothetical protein
MIPRAVWQQRGHNIARYGEQQAAANDVERYDGFHVAAKVTTRERGVMADDRKELARLGPYAFSEGSFDPAADTLCLGVRSDQTRSWTTPEDDDVFTDPESGHVVGLVVRRYQERLWDGPIEIPLPPASEGDEPNGRTLFLGMHGNPSSMCC